MLLKHNCFVLKELQLPKACFYLIGLVYRYVFYFFPVGQMMGSTWLLDFLMALLV